MRFKIGQKIVCVDTKGMNPLGTIKEGEIYTIVAFADANDCKSLILDTRENGNKFGYPFFYGYNPKRFEPLKYNIISNKDIISQIVEEKADVKIKEPECV